MSSPILEVKGLTKYYPIRKGWRKVKGAVKALDGINLAVYPGETLGIVGESGCGKSTAGRCILHLIKPTAGEVFFEGKPLSGLSSSELRQMRREMQMVFQDPLSTLNPKQTIRKILQEPLIAHKINKQDWDRLLEETITAVGLTVRHLSRYPHELSGGQRQRIGIARALMLRPKIIIADEPVSALDVSIQSQILNLMQDIQEQYGLTYVFISHDLNVVEHISDRVAVMYLGEIVEMATSEQLFNNPMHPYTKALLSAIPLEDPDEVRERIILQGDLPSPSQPPTGCKFHPRCPYSMAQCRVDKPLLRDYEGHQVACFLAENEI